MPRASTQPSTKLAAAARTRSTNADPQEALVRILFELHEALRKAYWSTPDEDAGDRLAALADAVYAIYTALNRGILTARSAEYERAKESMNAVNASLKATRDEIRAIVRNVEDASKVLAGIEKVITAAAGFFL